VVADNPAGGLYIDGGAPLIIDCVFHRNLGSPIFAYYSTLNVVNCLFFDNDGYVAGGIDLLGGSPEVANCTFVGNHAAYGGGAIYAEAGASATVTGCVAWQNTPNQFQSSGAALNVTYSLVQGGYAGEGNIDEDPRFIDPDADDFHIMPDSPCIDAGSNFALPDDVFTDLDGNLRFIDDPLTDDTGLGDPPIVDMGAYEYQADATGLYVIPMSGFVSGGAYGGPFLPGSKVYALRNYSDAPLEFSVSHTESWLDAFPPSGVIPSQDEIEVTVSITDDANALPHGAYQDVLEFVNETTHDGDTTRPVLLEVGVPVPIYCFPMDSDPGWSTEGLWAFGQPIGGGGQYGGPDPTSGYTGDYVYGYNLNGDYENNLPERHLTSNAIDCSNLTQVHLKFRRWLGVEQPSYDHAYVRVSTDGVTWTQVWTNPAEITDAGWNYQEFDISDVADNQPTVYLRWTMGVTDSSWQYCGWNVDDVEIWGVEPMPECPADFDDNGVVDTQDLLILLANWGTNGSGGGDVDGNGAVNTSDLLALLAAWGECP